jgi:hypothetical protein
MAKSVNQRNKSLKSFPSKHMDTVWPLNATNKKTMFIFKGDHDLIYKEAYLKSLEDPEKFWGDIAQSMISWDKNFEQVLDNSSE